ncbi:MAG: D-glycero-beta-D-manno-heptose-7-phosphate kinase [Burkholderiales bacterium]|nr:D-glycero-beta-D-manno-heptose-7-phosphate kinase [Burkholderiales bacterium]
MHLDAAIIEKIKNNLYNHKVLVVGDVMLDRYWFGEVKRISPEAPVPIAKISRTENRPGGAANVARNIASMGGGVTLLSVVGNDSAAEDLQEALSDYPVHTIFKVDASISTIVKLRVLAKNQQLIRVDFEEKPSHEILLDVLGTYEEIIQDYDLVILSDYGKGGLYHTTKMIEIARRYGKPIVVDPKGNDYVKYTGATIITPNRQEFQDAVGTWDNEDELLIKAKQLKGQLQLDYLLITRSEEGMTLLNRPNEVLSYPTIAQEVYDVSGAGDTVIAALGLMLANSIGIEDAALIANIAAGIVVGKVGTATLSKDELLSGLQRLRL